LEKTTFWEIFCSLILRYHLKTVRDAPILSYTPFYFREIDIFDAENKGSNSLKAGTKGSLGELPKAIIRIWPATGYFCQTCRRRTGFCNIIH